MVHQLVYLSRYVPEAGGGPLVTIRNILAKSHDNNFRDAITGFLIFDKTTFVQVLEGPRAAIAETYSRITNDPRHRDLTVIAAREVDQRAFPDWTMGGFLRAGDVQHIYETHGFDTGFEAGMLTADRIVALATDLEVFDRQRQGERTIDILAP